VDSTIESDIKQICSLSLGLEEGIISDQVMLYMDCDGTALINVIINRPVLNPARERTIEHVDKAGISLE